MYNYERKWWHDATIYEIYPKSFHSSTGEGDGDLLGIISKLPYLKTLGVDALWLCPIFMSPFKDSGYDVSDYYHINPAFGTKEDLELLIREAHNSDIRIILDMVINHTSDEHPWFVSACNSKDSPYRDYYIFRDKTGTSFPNNWISSKTLSPVWTWNATTNDSYLHIYTKHQPDLNWENSALRDEIYHMLSYWLDKGVDGFRLDVINKIAKKEGLPDHYITEEKPYADELFENNDKAHVYLREMHDEVFKWYPDALFLGQTAGITREQAYDYCHPSRQELDLYLQFEHMDIDRTHEGRRREWSVREFYDSVMKWQSLIGDGLWPTVFFGSHDSARMVARYGDVRPTYHELSAKMLCTLQLCLAGTQIIYMGDECGLGNVSYGHIDEFSDIRSHDIYRSRRNKGESRASILHDLRAVARDNARYCIPWDTIDKTLDDSDSIYQYYRRMLQLRRTSETLRTGDVYPLEIDEQDVFAYERIGSNVIMTVLANMSDREVALDMKGYGEVIIGNYEDYPHNCLRAYEVRLFRMET